MVTDGFLEMKKMNPFLISQVKDYTQDTCGISRHTINRCTRKGRGLKVSKLPEQVL